MERHSYRLIAFAYMPEHVHLLVLPQETASGVDELLKAIKRPFSYRIKRSLIENGSALLSKLTVRQRPGVTVFRFWQEGPGYDRNIVSLGTASAAIAYIHLNPIRRGLVKCELDWRWSSARHYADPSIPADHGVPSELHLAKQFLSDTSAGYLLGTAGQASSGTRAYDSSNVTEQLWAVICDQGWLSVLCGKNNMIADLSVR
ncbi:MAG: hypothetical protein WBG50_26330 [Desulfomonilaceae bacterium]